MPRRIKGTRRKGLDLEVERKDKGKRGGARRRGDGDEKKEPERRGENQGEDGRVDEKKKEPRKR